jgi:hypothetical protein
MEVARMIIKFENNENDQNCQNQGGVGDVPPQIINEKA